MSYRRNSNYVSREELLDRVRDLEEQLDRERRDRSEERYRLNRDVDYYADLYEEFEDKFHMEYDAHSRTIDKFDDFVDRTREEEDRLKDENKDFRDQNVRLECGLGWQVKKNQKLTATSEKQENENKILCKDVKKLKVTLKERDHHQDILEQRITKLTVEYVKIVAEKVIMEASYEPKPDCMNPLPYQHEPKLKSRSTKKVRWLLTSEQEEKQRRKREREEKKKERRAENRKSAS